jgi:prepilin-type processing-associated H-X9-DG protein
MPQGDAYRLPGNIAFTWELGLQPYVKSFQTQVCPSDSTSPRRSVAGFGDLKRSYAIANHLRNRALADIPAPTRTLVLSERRGCANNGTDQYHFCWEFNDTGPNIGAAGWQHVDAGNFLFADGHVKAMPGRNGGPYPRFPGYTLNADNSAKTNNGDPLSQS